jgi:hypothetical protein
MPDELALTMNAEVGKTGPALSTTSDMPVIDLTKPAEPAATEPAAKTEPAKTPEAPAASDSSSTKPTGEDPAAEPEHKQSKGVQKRIDELTRQRADAERLAAEQSARLDQALKVVEQLTGRNAQEAGKQTEEKDPRPAREQFDDPDAYDEALIEWSTRRTSAAFVAEAEAKRIEAQTKAYQEEVRTTWEKRRSQALTEMPDYVEVAESPDLQIRMPMAGAIVMADNGPQIAYHLGKNPDIAARIAALPANQQVFEMGILAASLKGKKPEVSNAPAPIKPLGGHADAVSKAPHEESMEEYAARRKQELNRARA